MPRVLVIASFPIRRPHPEFSGRNEHGRRAIPVNDYAVERGSGLKGSIGLLGVGWTLARAPG
jgi:hypothetical protein